MVLGSLRIIVTLRCVCEIQVDVVVNHGDAGCGGEGDGFGISIAFLPSAATADRAGNASRCARAAVPLDQRAEDPGR